MKISSVMCIVVLSALAGCGNDNDPRPTEGTAAVSAIPVVSTETQLATSEPISMEGAVSLNKDCNVEGIDARASPRTVVMARNLTTRDFRSRLIPASSPRGHTTCTSCRSLPSGSWSVIRGAN